MRLAFTLALVLLVSRPASASCIGSVAQQIATAMSPVPANALVVAGPLESDIPPMPGRADELATRVAQLVAGKLVGAHAAPKPLPLEQARASASRAPWLVYVHVQLQKSELHVAADAFPVIRNTWDRVRLPAPPPSGHAYATAPIDAEIRAFLPPLPLQLTSVSKASHGETDVLAIACGDLDGSGPELALVSRERVTLGRMRAGKVAVVRSVAWAELGKRAPVPLREPLGGAFVSGGSGFFGTSDRGGVAVDESLAFVRALTGIPIGSSMCAPISGSRLSFEGFLPCDQATVHPPAFDAASAFELVSSAGGEKTAIATREGGKLRLRIGGEEKASFDGAGAQVVVLDSNLDGAPEIAFSSDDTDDSITIATVDEHGVRVVNRIAAPGGVSALGACPPLESGTAPVVAVVGNEVWIVR